jgi:multiple sugar transport system substrate-binding protein
MFEIHNSWPKMFGDELSNMPSSVMSQTDFKAAFYPVITRDLITGKGIVAMPLEFDSLTLFVNDDIFTAAAKQPPNTWDELRSLAKQLTQRDERGVVIQSGIAMGVSNNVDYWPETVALMMLQNRVNLDNPSGSLAEDALSYYLLFLKDRTWDPILPPSTLAFASGRSAMFYGPSKSSFEIVENNPNLRFKTVGVPQLPKEFPNEPNVVYATYWAQSVWEESVNSKAAWEFLKFLSSQESLSKLNEVVMERTNLQIMSPRMSANTSYINDPILGSVAALATSAKSWYLADKTYDGDTGINSQFNDIFRDVVNKGEKGGLRKAIEDATSRVRTLLSKYSGG